MKKNLNDKLDPYWITGFSDAESSFSIRITKNKNIKIGWGISPIFSIEIHKKDMLILKRIQAFFGVGSIYESKSRSTVSYKVQSRKNLLEVIIPHFSEYPLLTQKRNDFLLFVKIVNILKNKQHTSFEELQIIINIRASINKGLTKELLLFFPNTISYPRSKVMFNYIVNPNWLVGFVDGEGCFYVKPNKFRFSVSFSISQHSRDKDLLKGVIQYLNCGLIENIKTRPNRTNFVVYKYSDICEKIIPFFEKYPVLNL